MKGQLEAALNAVKSGRPIREAERAFSIAESTVRLRLKTGCTKSAQLGRKIHLARNKKENWQIMS
jgi:hypothetical protein